MKKATSTRHNGFSARVTGSLRYVDDLSVPGMLNGRFVRLLAPRARITSVDKTDALKIPGVTAVYTAEDIGRPVPRFGPLVPDQPVLAEDETRFQGEPVAIVLAATAQAAERGAKAVRVSYEALPAVTTIEEAVAHGAPLVQDPSLRPDNKFRATNVMEEWHFEWGHLNSNWNRAPCTIEHVYEAPFIHHFALEPYAVLALPDQGGVTLHAAIQHPFVLRRVISAMLALPLAKVRIIATQMGGGFGGRGYPKIEPLAALLALRTGRAIKIALSGGEGFFLGHREAARIRICSGFTEAGEIVFQDIKADFLVGAYADISPRVVAKSASVGTAPYKVPNARICARGLFSHTPPTTAFRGFGATHFCWAVESQMNSAARVLGIDPVEIRVRNLPRKNEIFIPGDSPADGDWVSALHTAAQKMGWNSPVCQGRGRGIAIGIKSSIGATVSNARVTLHADGSATVHVGTTEMGQGSSIVMAELVHRSLGVSRADVSVVAGDTGRVPYDTITASSRSTAIMGRAVLDACEQVKKQLAETIAGLGQPAPESVDLVDGYVVTGEGRHPLKQAMLDHFGWSLGEIVGEGSYKGLKDARHPLGGPSPFWELIVTGVEVSVDETTGVITIHKLVNVSDAGKIINPSRAIGQDEGGIVMGLGAALMEQVIIDRNGRLMNADGLDYKIPTFADLPEEMVTIFQENGDGPGPEGAKGIGESGILAAVPAICEAMTVATGQFFDRLPLSPENVWRACRKRDRRENRYA